MLAATETGSPELNHETCLQEDKGGVLLTQARIWLEKVVKGAALRRPIGGTDGGEGSRCRFAGGEIFPEKDF